MARCTLLLCFALAALCAAGPAQASHVACGDVLMADTALDSDLRDCSGPGLVIGAPGVTLDLRGHLIEGRGTGAGLTNRGDSGLARFDGLQVRNGTIRGFADGISLAADEEPDDATFARLTVERNTGGGIECFQVRRCDVRNSRIRGNRFGVGLGVSGGHVTGSVITGNAGSGVQATGGATVERNLIARNGTGISAYDTSIDALGNRIKGNDVGIDLDLSHGLLADNRIAGGKVGIRLDLSSAEIRHNTVVRSAQTGILADESGAALDRNVIRGSGDDGVRLVSSSGELTANVVSRSGANGVLVDHDSCATLTRNVLNRNGANGLLVDGSRCDVLRVERNVAGDNRLDGIAVARSLSGVATLAGNRTDRNGDDGIDIDGVERYLGELEWAPGPLPVFSDEDGVWVVNPDGSGLRRLTDGTWPSWSRDGERLAFSDDGLNVIDADGTDRRRISELSGFQYQWSPDDAEVAFWGGGTNQTSDVFTAQADGGGLRQLTSTGFVQERHPTWSPDGSRLAITRLAFFDPAGENEDVYVMNADGSGLTPVTTTPERDIDARWSPDGSWIAFLRRTDATPHNEEWSLFVVRPDGTGERKLADAGVDTGGWDQLSWAPDGSRIAFLRDGDVYTIAPDGTGERRITSTPAEEVDPEWSPSRDALAFRVRDDSGQKVQIVTATGSPLGLAALPIVTLARNVADRNSDLGIEAVAAIDGGGNRARRNGDSRQCTGVACNG